jgi:hypothetical protein
MAAYYQVDVVLNSQAVTVGLPSPQSVTVTLPTVGPAGPQGPAGASQADVLTVQGDLLYRGASTAARLPIGTAGQVLKVNAGATAPEWGAAAASGVTSVALAGTGLSITGSPVTSSGTITANVSYGTTAGTACQGNDGRIAGIESGSINIAGATFTAANAGFSITTADGTGEIVTGDGGSIYIQEGGGINTSLGGGSINTRGTGSIELGISGTRTSLTGTATADRAIALPDASGTVALTDTVVNYASGAAALYDYADVQAQNARMYYNATSSPTWSVTDGQGFRDAINCPASGAITGSGLTQSANRIIGRTTAGTGAVQEITVSGGASLSAGALTIHAQSHAITSTSDHTAGNNKVFYSNGSGQIVELALGASGTILTSGGTTSAPTFSAPAAGGATNFWIPASAWIPRTTTGCGVDSAETSTNKINTDQLLFDAAAIEYAQAAVVMPNNWNASTITAKFYWTASSGSGDVVWQIAGRALANDDALDQAMGTAQTATDTLTAANDMDISPATSAVTLAGSPAAGQLVIYEISRKATDAADTLAVDGRLLGVEISFN